MSENKYLIDDFLEKDGYIIFDTPYGDRQSFLADNVVAIGTEDGGEEIVFWLKGLPKPIQFAIGARDFGRCLSHNLCRRLQERFGALSPEDKEN